ncbi:MAG: ATP-binding protein [candidate division KSB1 bacterium]|nr:ATP-binding protein [candidate division KSB1 bacterium]
MRYVQKLMDKVRPYHFELKHLMVLLSVLVFFQVLVSFIHKVSLQKFLVNTQEWYQRDFAEKLANLTATSLELLLETSLESRPFVSDDEAKKIIQAFNIILSEQLLQHHVQQVCLLLGDGANAHPVDNGQQLFATLFWGMEPPADNDTTYARALQLYREHFDEIISQEQIRSLVEPPRTFHVFVPFVPKGELMGALYMKYAPDFGIVTSGIVSSYNESSLIFTGLIFFGLLAMFYISSYTVKERDEAQRQLFEERERQLRERIHHQKEALFAKRIYHTHHKAEKIMGFIKEDLRRLSVENIQEVKYRVSKYANFISRVIYDMKTYDPPIQAIRGPMFRTDINELLQFLVDNIFRRVSAPLGDYQFQLDLDPNLPVVHVNEFVVWEVFEPLIQNSLDHAGDGQVTVHIRTVYDPEKGESKVYIGDNGVGIRPDLLLEENGVKRLFLENVSTKTTAHQSGYGCYIAYEIATQRCGWRIDAENLSRGCQFVITIPNESRS